MSPPGPEAFRELGAEIGRLLQHAKDEARALTKAAEEEAAAISAAAGEVASALVYLCSDLAGDEIWLRFFDSRLHELVKVSRGGALLAAAWWTSSTSMAQARAITDL